MENIELPIKTIKDSKGNVYVLDSVLGHGGQGMVCKTKDKAIAVKFVMKDDHILQDDKYYDLYSNKINDVIVMHIDSDINLCHPYTMLERPYCGYVMHVLSNLKPVSNLIYDPNSDNGLNSQFLESGGLKKRLEVLIELARTLARLHSKGIVYCDISPSNVFFSETENFSKVWLIDCDNLKYTNDNKKGIFTPGYGAPEVALNVTSNTIFSDCFSFAVLAFKVLTSRNPFEVNYDDIASSDGWDATTKSSSDEDNISANNIPWLFENGVVQKEYFDHFLTKKLIALFDKTFSKKGRCNPESRPSMQEWYSALKDCYLSINKCQCGRYIFAGEKECPFCHNKPSSKCYGILTNVYHNTKEEPINKVKEDQHKYDFEDLDFIDGILDDQTKVISYKVSKFMIYEDCTIYNFNVNQISICEAPYPLVKFKQKNGYLFIENKSASNVIYYYRNKKGTLVSGQQLSFISIGKGFLKLSFKDPDSIFDHFIIINSI